MPQGPATAETVAETLTDALTLLGPGGDHWTQGALTRRNPDGTFSYCLVGAIERAAPNYESYAAARHELKATLSADGNGTKLDRWFHDFEGILAETFPFSSSADRRLTSRGVAPFWLKDGPNVP